MSAPGRLVTSWDPVEEVWFHWPEQLDPSSLESARDLIVALCGAFVDFEHSGVCPSLLVRVLVHSEEGMQSAKVALGAFRPSLHRVEMEGPFCGREPILFWRQGRQVKMIIGAGASSQAVVDIDKIVRRAGLRIFPSSLAFERGAIDTDGAGTALLTRAHWLRPSWNANLHIERLQSFLLEDFGLSQTIWIDRGLPGDCHRDHLYRVARFAGSGRIVCLRSFGTSDPHAGVFDAVRRNLERQTDADGKPFEVFDIPSPPPQLNERGHPYPLSYLGYLQVNGLIIVPVFNDGDHGPVRRAFQTAFPDARIILHRASLELEPGGAFNSLALKVPA